MAERITWADVRPGDVLDIRGQRWTVTTVVLLPSGAVGAKLMSEAGTERAGTREPDQLVTVVERKPDPEPAALAALAPLKPELLCDYLDNGVVCGAPARRFMNANRCEQHAPEQLAVTHPCGGRVPAEPGPGQRCIRCGKPIRGAK